MEGEAVILLIKGSWTIVERGADAAISILFAGVSLREMPFTRVKVMRSRKGVSSRLFRILQRVTMYKNRQWGYGDDGLSVYFNGVDGKRGMKERLVSCKRAMCKQRVSNPSYRGKPSRVSMRESRHFACVPCALSISQKRRQLRHSEVTTSPSKGGVLVPSKPKHGLTME